ncbi:peptidase inhibitor family I36 protein [Saccharothrix isguenensis]
MKVSKWAASAFMIAMLGASPGVAGASDTPDERVLCPDNKVCFYVHPDFMPPSTAEDLSDDCEAVDLGGDTARSVRNRTDNWVHLFEDFNCQNYVRTVHPNQAARDTGDVRSWVATGD